MWFYPLWIPHGCPGSAQGKEPFWFHITKEFALIDFHLPEHFAQVFLCRESFQTNGCILKMTSSSASTIKLISISYRPALPRKFYWDFCHGWKDTNRILSKSRELLLSLVLSLAAAGPGHCWLSERLIQYKSPKRDLAGSRVFTPHCKSIILPHLQGRAVWVLSHSITDQFQRIFSTTEDAAQVPGEWNKGGTGLGPWSPS